MSAAPLRSTRHSRACQIDAVLALAYAGLRIVRGRFFASTSWGRRWRGWCFPGAELLSDQTRAILASAVSFDATGSTTGRATAASKMSRM